MLLLTLAFAAWPLPAGAGLSTPSVLTREEAVLVATAHHLAASFCGFGPCLVTVDKKPPSKRVVAALEDTTALRASLSDADRKSGHIVTVGLHRPRFVSVSRAEVATSVTLNGVALEACTFPVVRVWRSLSRMGTAIRPAR